MLQRILSEPWSFWGGIVIWLPLAVWIISLVGWTVTGEIDALAGFAGVLLAVGLGALTLNPPDKSLPPLILTAVVLTTVLFPLVRQMLQKRALNSIDADLVERAYQTLREKPASVGSEVRIASVMYDRGLPGHAIAIVERIIAGMPKGVFGNELEQMASKWRLRTAAGHLRQTVVCATCGTSNEPGPVYCSRCGAPFLLDYLRGGIVGVGIAGKLVLIWLIAIIAAVGLAWSAVKLPPAIAAASIAGICAAVVGIVWIVLRRKESTD